MSATGMFDTLNGGVLTSALRLPHRALILCLYLPSILVTVLGATALSMCWVSIVHANPGGAWIIAMGLVQLAWFISLVDIWLQNTYSVLRREITAVSGGVLRVYRHL